MSDDIPSATQPVSVCFLTEPTLQAQAFLSLLQTETLIPITLHNIRTPLPEMLPAGTLVLFDIVSANKRLSTFWQNALRKQIQPINVVLMNMDDQERGKPINEWPSLSDIIYRSDTQPHVNARIKETLQISYNLLQGLTSHLFQPPERDTPAETTGELLTDREKQILNKLCKGATNNDIASSLFISEHTVRTHIYNIFKKIKVKNRTQAMYWATVNLEKMEIRV